MNLNTVAIVCVVGAVLELSVAIVCNATDQQLAAASGLALLLANTAGTIAGRTKKGSGT